MNREFESTTPRIRAICAGAAVFATLAVLSAILEGWSTITTPNSSRWLRAHRW